MRWQRFGMLRSPPRHLAPPRTRAGARQHRLVELVLVLVAIGLAGFIMTGSLLDEPAPEASAARLPNLLPPAPTTTAPGQEDGNLLGDPGFETGQGDWRSVGQAGVRRVDQGRRSQWALRLSRGSSKWPGVLDADVTRLQQSARYTATAWVQASGADTLVRINLYEVLGGERHPAGTVEAMADAGAWRQVELVHQARRPGAVLAMEILAPDLTTGTGLLVDELAVRASVPAPTP
jgi:hypothetical protein